MRPCFQSLKYFVLAFSFGTSLGLPALAEADPPSVTIGWAEATPTIDGRLDEAVWEEAGLIDQLLQVTPVPGAEPSQKTDLYILTDGKTLFIGIRCHDTDPSEIVANMMLRDDFLFWDDRVVIGLDTFNDHRNGYAFEVNPRGARHDVLVEGDSFNGDWTTLWFAETTIDSKGWTVEIAIPFHSISFDPNSDVWGFNFGRGIRRNDEQDRWSDTQPQRFVSDFGVAGSLVGMSGIQQGLGVKITPAVTMSRFDDPLQTEHQADFSPSLDAFYSFHPSVTAAVTANTGFGETEVDDRKVNLTRFPLFFPEKREFFLQDALIFNFADYGGMRSSQNGRPFDSRRIGLTPDGEVVDILAGVKLTGRLGPVKFGFFDTVLQEHDDIGKQNVAVGRVAINVLEESSIGGIFTAGNPDGGANNGAVGLDFNYTNSDFNGGQSLLGNLWFTNSFSEGVGGGEASFGGILEYPNDRTNWKISAREIQENYNPAVGFVSRQGIRKYTYSYRNRIRRRGFLRTVDSITRGYVVTNLSNEVESAQFNLAPARLTSEVADNISMAYRHEYQRLFAPFTIHEKKGITIPIGKYHADRGFIRVETSRNRPLRASLQITAGGFYGGRRTNVLPTIAWRPSQHWLFELEYELADISLPQGDFKTHLLKSQANVQFTPNLAWITIVQWDNLSHDVGINSRLHWIIEDGREFFVVLNQNLDTSDGLRRGRTEPLIKFEWTFNF
jgi:hypothetical protein